MSFGLYIVFLSIFSETERKSLLRQRSGDIKDAQACLELYVKESFPNVIDLVKSRDAPVNVCLPFPTSIVSEYARDNFRSSEKYSHGKNNGKYLYLISDRI